MVDHLKVFLETIQGPGMAIMLMLSPSRWYRSSDAVPAPGVLAGADNHMAAGSAHLPGKLWSIRYTPAPSRHP